MMRSQRLRTETLSMKSNKRESGRLSLFSSNFLRTANQLFLEYVIAALFALLFMGIFSIYTNQGIFSYKYWYLSWSFLSFVVYMMGFSRFLLILIAEIYKLVKNRFI